MLERNQPTRSSSPWISQARNSSNGFYCVGEDHTVSWTSSFVMELLVFYFQFVLRHLLHSYFFNICFTVGFLSTYRRDMEGIRSWNNQYFAHQLFVRTSSTGLRLCELSRQTRFKSAPLFFSALRNFFVLFNFAAVFNFFRKFWWTIIVKRIFALKPF